MAKIITFPASFNPHMLPKLRSEDVMAAASGAPCTLRICSFFPGYQCSGTKTTVGAHLPVFGKGVSTKVTDLAVAFACGRCHDILDGRDADRYNYLVEKYPGAMMERCLHGLVETWTLLAMAELIIVPDARWI